MHNVLKMQESRVLGVAPLEMFILQLNFPAFPNNIKVHKNVTGFLLSSYDDADS